MEIAELIAKLGKQTVVYEVTQAVFEKVAYRENSDGILAVVSTKYYKLTDIKLKRNPLIIVLEKVEKPGNLGAILRTADAAAVDAVLVCDPLTDTYNPNVIRSSIGCVFSSMVVCCTSQEALDWLNSVKIKSYAAALTAKSWYHETSFLSGAAIVMGTEADWLI
ncbi:MAG: RNA methyltransferase [Bacteroidales bacterium]|nr:RNA methyltransferase [Bacteroidales bacterium]